MEKLKIWWKYDGRYIIPNIIQGIKNIIIWLPIIWQDRNYDHSYIYSVLEFKLDQQSKYLRNKDRHVSTQWKTDKMDMCVRLLKLIREDYYECEHLNYQETTLDFTPIDNSDYLNIDINEVSENFQAYFDKYPLVYKKVTQSSKYVYDNTSKVNIARNIGIYNKRRSEAILYKTIQEHIGGWWD